MSACNTTTKHLEHLLEGLEYSNTGHMGQIEITGLASDSRKVEPGNLFAALKGLSCDGHKYIGQAVASGCSALLVNKGWQEYARDKNISNQVPIVEVDDTKTALGNIAANFYDHPDRQLTVIGITGTNGKTTTSFLVESLLKACGKRPGVIGTVNYRYTDRNDTYIEMEAPFTTPESPTLFALLREMADQDITDVVMEVSSHALAQSRLTGLEFDIGVFTNLSRDHLDFHSDMDDYYSSKKLLFTNYLKPRGRVVIVLDDMKEETESRNNWSEMMQEELKALYDKTSNSPAIITCGESNDCDVHPRSFSINIDGIKAEIRTPAGDLALKTPLVGQFNLRNMLCSIGIGIAHNEKLDCMQNGLQYMKTIPGRLERVSLEKDHPCCPTVFVDYAHTPDALKNVLTALKELNPKRLICIFGCGGDRDSGKRGLMGEIAGKLSDVVLATSDNPRSEDPEVILAQIEEGLSSSPLSKISAQRILLQDEGRGFDIIIKRRSAIQTAIRFANPEDVILISGKGHENYQISSTGKIFFDDRIEAEMQMHAAAGLAPAWNLDWVQQITGGRLLHPVNESPVFNSISTDSRSIKAGDLFVALKGENFDGRKFAAQAIEKGAAGLLINQTSDPGEAQLDIQTSMPILLVPDTLVAFGQLAANLRCWNNDLQVVAITGSSGKTTVKEMTGAILSRKHSILKTEGNFNNLIGLPLTLLGLQADHEIAVVEMGMNSPGEIARLTEIADPDIACIVNVQEAHLEGLGDLRGVAKAKNELFAGLKRDGKVAVNLDDPIVKSLAAELKQEKITFGCNAQAFVRATNVISLGVEGMKFTLHIGAESRRVTIKALGSHNVSNSLAAAAMAYGLDIGIKEISLGLSAFEPYDKRTRVEELPSGLRVLNDCYNANPASMLAALNTVMDLKKDCRVVAVLGDMLELGEKSDEAHETVGKAVYEIGIDFLAAFGSRAQQMVSGAKYAGMDPENAKSFSSKNDLASWLHALMQEGKIKSGDWLLLKGSRGMRMEEILELLRINRLNKAGGN